MNKKNQTFVHEEPSKEGCYGYLKSKIYHFDRPWKELERPNASFEGRTTHPIIRSVKNNTVVDRIRKKTSLFKIFRFLAFGRRVLTRTLLLQRHTHTANYY